MADDDQKQLVALGYDRIADSYLERFGRSSVRAAKLAELIEQLPAGASILDLGCGAGIPVAHELVTLGFQRHWRRCFKWANRARPAQCFPSSIHSG